MQNRNVVVGRHEGDCFLIGLINSLPNADTFQVILAFVRYQRDNQINHFTAHSPKEGATLNQQIVNVIRTFAWIFGTYYSGVTEAIANCE